MAYTSSTSGSPPLFRDMSWSLTGIVGRFWGIDENAREAKKDFSELTDRVRKGLPLYGESSLSPYMQAVAAKNSTFSQYMFVGMPW